MSGESATDRTSSGEDVNGSLKSQNKDIPKEKQYRIGDTIPDFEAMSQLGRFRLYDYFSSWGILFSHPADFTPVCATELGQIAKLYKEFKARGVRVAALSCDNVDSHKDWLPDIKAITGHDVQFPIIADADRKISFELGMLSRDHMDSDGLPLTVRDVWIIGPDRKVKCKISYPASTGRNFTEILRVVDSLQLTATNLVATPADWVKGDETVILPSVSNDKAMEMFSSFRVCKVPSGKEYMRMTKDPAY